MSIAVFPGYQVLKLGSHGSTIRELQRDLNARFQQLDIIDAVAVLVDGSFGPQTLNSIKYLQCIGGLPVNGAVEERTLDFIAKGVLGLETLTAGSFGTGVLAVQQAILKSQVRVSTDGHFGPLTERGVRIYQQKSGLVVDGVVGPKTWEWIVRSRLKDLPCIALLPDPYH